MDAPRASLEQIAANARGVAFAAFAPLDAITTMLGGDAEAARALQEAAVTDWSRLQIAVQQSKARG